MSAPRIVIGKWPRRPAGETEETLRLATITGDLRWRGNMIFLPRLKFLLLLCLIGAQGGFVDRRDVFDFLYGDRSDGGPLDGKVIDIHLSKIRRMLLSTDLRIECQYTMGWRVEFLPALQMAVAA